MNAFAILVHCENLAGAWKCRTQRPFAAGPVTSAVPAPKVNRAEGFLLPAIAIGEPAAALPIARRGAQSAVRYLEVALLAAALGDELLAASLRCSYLEPLGRERDGGRACRETLRAYLRSEGNVSSAAATLHSSRNTVGSRLRAAEEAIGRPLAECSAELEVALELEGLAAS